MRAHGCMHASIWVGMGQQIGQARAPRVHRLGRSCVQAPTAVSNAPAMCIFRIISVSRTSAITVLSWAGETSAPSLKFCSSLSTTPSMMLRLKQGIGADVDRLA